MFRKKEKSDEPKPKKTPGKIALQTILLIVFFFFGVMIAGFTGYFIMIYYTGSSKTVTIPYVIQDSEQSAIQKMKDANLRPIPEGTGTTVIYTIPKPGTQVKEGHHIIVGFRDVRAGLIPDLTGIPVEVAEEFLNQYKKFIEKFNDSGEVYKLYYDKQEQGTNDQTKDGMIITMYPAPGTPIQNTQTITLIVGKYQQ